MEKRIRIIAPSRDKDLSAKIDMLQIEIAHLKEMINMLVLNKHPYQNDPYQNDPYRSIPQTNPYHGGIYYDNIIGGNGTVVGSGIANLTSTSDLNITYTSK